MILIFFVQEWASLVLIDDWLYDLGFVFFN